MIRITGLPVELDFKRENLIRAAAKKLRLPEKALHDVRLCKKSVDARKKDRVHFVCAVEAAIDGDENRLVSRLKDQKIQLAPQRRYQLPEASRLPQRPLVVGFGPAGMFAGLVLAQCGQRPIILERGECVEKREKTVTKFWMERTLKKSSNVQFGEGGAGTFSDGKLTTGTNDIRIRKVLEELAEAGAPEEILYEAKPHIGTDRLPGTVKAIRERILSLGGEVRFETAVTGLRSREGALCGLELDRAGAREVLECSQVILAIGHSARDTFETLFAAGIPMQAKAFSVGARIEHPQELIDRAQYGGFAGAPRLGAADYKLSCHLENGRGVYTFCMCPGGYVTGAASEPGGVVTNGMSPYARDGANSNAALLVGVAPEDYGAEGPLAGVQFQRRLERLAFRAAGEGYGAPAQRVEDFLTGKSTACFGAVKPTYQPEAVPGSLNACLPEFVTESMREGIRRMGKQLSGFDWGDAVLTAPETRSSSPVRILRGEDCQSLGMRGLYPCGEGAGYAGGIVSAAVDGIRCAEAVLGFAGKQGRRQEGASDD